MKKGKIKDEMVRWHHWLHGHELEQAVGDSEGQGSLACCSPWGHKESDTTERLPNNDHPTGLLVVQVLCGTKFYQLLGFIQWNMLRNL